MLLQSRVVLFLVVLFLVVVALRLYLVRSCRVKVMVMVMEVLHLVDALVEVTMSGFLVEYICCFVVVPVGLVYPLDY